MWIHLYILGKNTGIRSGLMKLIIASNNVKLLRTVLSISDESGDTIINKLTKRGKCREVIYHLFAGRRVDLLGNFRCSEKVQAI